MWSNNILSNKFLFTNIIRFELKFSYASSFFYFQIFYCFYIIYVLKKKATWITVIKIIEWLNQNGVLKITSFPFYSILSILENNIKKFITNKIKKIIMIIYYSYICEIKNRRFEYNFKYYLHRKINSSIILILKHDFRLINYCSIFYLSRDEIRKFNTREELYCFRNQFLEKKKKFTNFMKFNLTSRHYFFTIYLTLNLSGMLWFSFFSHLHECLLFILTCKREA